MKLLSGNSQALCLAPGLVTEAKVEAVSFLTVKKKLAVDLGPYVAYWQWTQKTLKP